MSPDYEYPTEELDPKLAGLRDRLYDEFGVSLLGGISNNSPLNSENRGLLSEIFKDRYGLAQRLEYSLGMEPEEHENVALGWQEAVDVLKSIIDQPGPDNPYKTQLTEEEFYSHYNSRLTATAIEIMDDIAAETTSNLAASNPELSKLAIRKGISDQLAQSYVFVMCLTELEYQQALRLPSLLLYPLRIRGFPEGIGAMLEIPSDRYIDDHNDALCEQHYLTQRIGRHVGTYAYLTGLVTECPQEPTDPDGNATSGNLSKRLASLLRLNKN